MPSSTFIAQQGLGRRSSGLRKPDVILRLKISQRSMDALTPLGVTRTIFSMRYLNQVFQHLNARREPSERQKLAIERYKLAALRAVAKTLPKHPITGSSEKDTAPESSTFWRVAKRIAWGTIAVFGFAFASADAYVGSRSFIGMLGDVLFGGIPTLLLDGLGLLFSVTSFFLYYSFEASNLEKSLGITSTNNASPLLDAHEKQYKLAKQINESLAYRPISKAYIQAAKCFNDDLKRKTEEFKKGYEESGGVKATRFIVVTLGTIMAASSTFFSANIYLGLIGGGVLAGTPLGWAILGMISLASAAAYLACQSKRFFKTLNSTAKRFDQLTQKYIKFSKRHENIDHDLQVALDDENSHRREPHTVKYHDRLTPVSIGRLEPTGRAHSDDEMVGNYYPFRQ